MASDLSPFHRGDTYVLSIINEEGVDINGAIFILTFFSVDEEGNKKLPPVYVMQHPAGSGEDILTERTVFLTLDSDTTLNIPAGVYTVGLVRRLNTQPPIVDTLVDKKIEIFERVMV